MDFVHSSTEYLRTARCRCQALGQAEAVKTDTPGPDPTEWPVGGSRWTAAITAQREISFSWTHKVVVGTRVGAEEKESKLAWGET